MLEDRADIRIQPAAGALCNVPSSGRLFFPIDFRRRNGGAGCVRCWANSQVFVGVAHALLRMLKKRVAYRLRRKPRENCTKRMPPKYPARKARILRDRRRPPHRTAN